MIEKKCDLTMKLTDLNSTLSALYMMRKDHRVPRKSKILIAIAVGYVLSPIDLIPDFIPFLGQLDDLLIVPALVGLALKSIPNEVMEEYKTKARQTKLTKRLNTITFVIIVAWILIVVWLIRIILKLM